MRRKDIKTAIKEHFLTYPTTKLRVREIERTLHLPLPSVIRYCRELEKEGIIATIKTGNVTVYTADRGSPKYVLEKKLNNIRCAYESGLVDSLKTELSNPGIVLFGSYAKGEDTEESDIDIYIETPSKRQPNIEKFEKILKRHIHLFQHKNLKEITNKNLANNIINGITLNKQIEAI